ncbi:outer membrane protein assembly factor [soil metagenome]
MTLLLGLALVISQVTAQATASPQAIRGTADVVGKNIVATEIVLEGRHSDDPTLRDLVETRAGTPLSMATVRESMSHLYSLGRFQDIQVETFEVPGGINVRFNLIPIHVVERVEFRGDVGLDKNDLRRAVSDRFGSTPSPGRGVEVAQMLERFYQDHGYLRATVRPTQEVFHDPDRTVLIFEINAGVRARVAQASIAGDPGEPEQAFLRRVHAQPGTFYQRADLDERLREFVQRVRKKGHYQANASHRSRESADGRSVDLDFELQIGPLVSLKFEGDPIPADKISELVPVRAESSAEEDLIEDSERRLTEYLRQQGYWKASVIASKQTVDRRLVIVFTVRHGLLYRIAEGGVEVTGNASLPIDVLQPSLIRLQADIPYTSASLAAATGAFRALYLMRGFAQSKVTSAENERNPAPNGEGRIKPAIVIVEGPRTRIGTVTFSGNTALSSEALSARILIGPDQPYFEPNIIRDRDALQLEYLNRGYATATISVVPTVSPDSSTVDLLFDVREGPQTIVDHILIVGNVKTAPEVIQREILLRSGEPLGLTDLIESQRRLGSLGLFRRIRITEISHSGSERHDVLITVEEAPSTSIGYGAGLEATRLLRADQFGIARERFEVAPRGFFEVGRRNLGGRNRSLNLYSRLGLRPDVASSGQTTQFGFAEYRVVGTYREPRAFGINADFGVSIAAEQGVRSSFNFERKGVNAEVLKRLTTKLRVGGRYALQSTRTFDETFSDQDNPTTIERIFPRVRVSAFSGSVSRDSRDDVLDPTRGKFLSAEGSLAARALGGQVGFLKSFVQASWFRKVPAVKGVIFAGRAAVGAADGFPRSVQAVDASGMPIPYLFVVVEDLPASERFFAGGDTTIRGYALDSVGADNTITPNGFPRGGNGLVLLNAELRVPVWNALGAAFFLDGGNVFGRASQIDFTELRGSVGFGFRYRSPIGPVRLDLGFKLGSERFGADTRRMVPHLSIGHAF